MLGRLGARALEPVDLLGDEVARRRRARRASSSLVRYSPTTSSSPSPSSLRIAASCWRSRNSRCCLSTPSVTSLRIVSATCSSARWSRGPRQHELDARRRRRPRRAPRGGGPRRARPTSTTPSASAPGLEAGAQQLGQPARAAQLGDQLERRRAARGRAPRRAASGAGRGGSRRRRTSAPRSEAWTATMRARVSTRTMATGSPVGRTPMSGTWATTASWPSPARSSDAAVAGARAASTARRSWSVTRARVMTAPGSTVAGSSASGRRTSVRRRVADVAVRRVAHASKDIDRIVADLELDTSRLRFVGCVAERRRASSQLTALVEELAVGHHQPRAR